MGPLLYENLAYILNYDQARVNGRSNYEFPGQRWVLKLVYKYNP